MSAYDCGDAQNKIELAFIVVVINNTLIVVLNNSDITRK